MGPRIHLIRHAQGLHNVSAANTSTLDPVLTAYGRRQCAKLAANWPADTRIALLAASPLRRTLTTAKLSFPNHSAPILAVPDAQEVGDWPCDRGSPRDVLEREFNTEEVNLRLVQNGWDAKTGRYAGSREAIAARARDLRRWLREKCEQLQEEGDVVLVTHGGFLHFLTQDWSDYDRHAGTGWRNTEWRTYEFADSTDVDARMVETSASKARHNLVPKPDRSKYIRMQREKAGQMHASVPQPMKKKIAAL